MLRYYIWQNKAIIINTHNAEFDEDWWRSYQWRFHNSDDNTMPRYACVQSKYAFRYESSMNHTTNWSELTITTVNITDCVSGNAIRVSGTACDVGQLKRKQNLCTCDAFTCGSIIIIYHYWFVIAYTATLGSIYLAPPAWTIWNTNDMQTRDYITHYCYNCLTNFVIIQS